MKGISDILPISIFLIAGLLILISHNPNNILQVYSQEINENKNENKNNEIKLSTLLKDGAPILGNPNATITIIDFSDFQCYMCARYVKSTEPLIKENYIDTGKVNLIFKHFPIRGFDSMGASLAAQCLNDQGKFWQFHHMLYHNQGRIDSGWVNTENLKNLANQIDGVNMEEFSSCLDNKTYKTYVENDLELAKKYQFKDSPSFIIINSDGTDPEFLSGAHPFPSFSHIIDKKLKNLQK